MIAFLIEAEEFSSPELLDEAFQVLERTESSVSIRCLYVSAENLKGLTGRLRIWVVRPFVNLPTIK